MVLIYYYSNEKQFPRSRPDPRETLGLRSRLVDQKEMKKRKMVAEGTKYKNVEKKMPSYRSSLPRVFRIGRDYENVKKGKNASGQLTMPEGNAIKNTDSSTERFLMFMYLYYILQFIFFILSSRRKFRNTRPAETSRNIDVTN